MGAPSRPARERGPGILLNSAMNIGGQVLAGALGALGGLLTVRALGPEGYGILGVTFILADFGRPLSSFTHIPSILQVHRGREPGVVFATSLAIKLTLSALFCVAILVVSPFLVETFHLPPWTVVLASVVILAGSFYEVGAARLEAENRMARSNVIYLSGLVAGLAGITFLFLMGWLTVYTSILMPILANVAMSIGALVTQPVRRVRVDWRLGLDMTNYGWRILATALLTQGLLQTDTLLISHMLGNAQAGVYTVVFALTYVMVTASSAMGVALVAALSELAGRGEDTRSGYQRGTLIALGVGLALGVVYLVGGRTILGFYGSEFEEGYLPLLILTVFGVAASLAIPAATMLNVHGRAGTQTVISLAQLALNVPLNVWLIGEYGLTGAALATTSVFLVGTLASWVTVRRVTGAWPFSAAVFQEALAYPKRRRGAL
jgi:O-antigen/teichoic acid export membrane protein